VQWRRASLIAQKSGGQMPFGQPCDIEATILLAFGPKQQLCSADANGYSGAQPKAACPNMGFR
jgi:hypothetical protein